MEEGPGSPVVRREAGAATLADEAAEGVHSISLRLFKSRGRDANGDLGQENRDSTLVMMKCMEEYFRECERLGLVMDDALLQQALELFRKVRCPLLTNVDATETSRGVERIWGPCLLYTVKRLSGVVSGEGKNGSCFTLSQLLQITRLSVVEFYKELAQFVSKVGPTMKTLFGEDYERRLQIRESQTNFAHLGVLFSYYKRVYQDYFLGLESPAPSRPGSKFSLHVQFGWLLFLVLRVRVLPQFTDLVTCTNGLLAVITTMILHMPPALRKVSADDSSKFAVRTPEGVNVIASLCHLYYASEKDVSDMVEKAGSMISDILHRSHGLSIATRGGQVYGFSTDGVPYFQGLMEDGRLASNLDSLERDYELFHEAQGELDERVFIREDETLIGATSLSSLSVSGVKRKFDAMSSPQHVTGASAGTSPLGTLNSPCSSPLKGESVAVASSKMPPPTPVTTSMTTAKWFRTVIAPLPSEPSAELLQAFRSCDHDVTSDIRTRVQILMEGIFSSSAAGNWRVWGGARGTALTDSIWAVQRRMEATKLYYKVLGAMCRSEAQRQPGSNLTSLLTNERFHRCMIACSAELVLATHKTVTMTFHAVLEATGITAFDLSKVIEGFVRYEETLPRELKRHLNSLEERLLESMAWERGSSMYNSLLVAKPSFAAEINRLCLLPEPMPSLDVPIVGILQRHSAEGVGGEIAASPPRPSVGWGGKGSIGILGSSEQPGMSSLRSPAKERPSAFSAFTSPLKGRMQPSLQSQFASPQRPGPLGGGETCAEIVINVFFQKVLKLAAIRIRSLCERLQVANAIMEQVFGTMKQMLHNGTSVFFNRHIDQLILCCIYGVCKVSRVNVTFRDIIFHYRKQPQCKPNVFRNVFIDSPSMRRTGKASGQEAGTGDIIRFYNEVFVPTAKVFLLRPGSNGTSSLSTGESAEGSGSDGQPPEGAEPSTFPTLPDMSPKKVSATHNVFVSPLRAMKMDFIMSPHTRSLYACVGESTHAYQSPSKDLSAINSRLNNSRRLDFGDNPLVRERDPPTARAAAEESSYPSSSRGGVNPSGVPQQSQATPWTSSKGVIPAPKTS